MTDGIDTTTLLLIVGAAIVAALIAWILVRSARRGRGPVLSERAGDERPYLRPPAPASPPATSGAGVADEVAAAARDVVGDVLQVDAARSAGADDLEQMKGVGPKLAARLRELGITRFSQLAGLNENEIEHLDDRLGPFRGRVARDRLVEQAHYLARGDIDGFEEKFGKLGG